LKEANKAQFQRELAMKDQGDQGFQGELKAKQASDAQEIDQGYEKHKGDVMDMLLRHVCTVELQVSEALKQSLLTKSETGGH